MADVNANLKNWSTTLASNAPAGNTAVGTGLAPNLQQIQATVRQDLATKGADIASAATTDLGAVAGLMHDITGTTTITSFGTVSAGIWKIVKFEGALTLTHNATSLILPGGANISTADGDIGVFISEGAGNWRCVSYSRVSGSSVVPITSGTKQATTSGTAINFTSIPAGVKRITMMFNGVSSDGTSVYLVQIGDSGGLESTGYVSSAFNISAQSDYTSGFGLQTAATAANSYYGQIILSLQDASTNTWVASGGIGASGSGNAFSISGGKALSATLDRVTLTTVNGTDAFDAGSVNIIYE